MGPKEQEKNIFSNMSDDEVLDVATAPNIDEATASEAEAEYYRRMSQESAGESLRDDERASGAIGGTALATMKKTIPRHKREAPNAEYYDSVYGQMPHREKIHARQDNPAEAQRREYEREKDQRNEAQYDKRTASAARGAFFRATKAEGLPNREQQEHTKAEILADAETQIRSHFDDLMLQGLISEYRRGVKKPNYERVLSERYGAFIDRRAWTYGLDNESEDDGIKLRDIKADIADEIIPRIIEGTDPEHLHELEREALLELVEQGVYTDEDELGQPETRYSIPESFGSNNPQVEKFEQRYGVSSPRQTPEQMMREAGIDFENPAVQNASFHGFFAIADQLAKHGETDVSKLDWYFDNFGYANRDTLTRFLTSLEASVGIDDRTRSYIETYLGTKPAYLELQAELSSPEATAEELADIEETISELELEDGIDAIKRICETYGIEIEDVDSLTLDDIQAEIFTQQGEYRQQHGNTVIRTGEDVHRPYDESRPGMRDVFDPEAFDKAQKRRRPRKSPEGEVIRRNGSEVLGEDYARQKALHMIALYLRIREIDPDAQIGFPGKRVKGEDGRSVILQDRKYLIIRFGCESTHPNENGELVTSRYNHVIAESTTVYGATYLWYGHGDDWKRDLHGKKGDALALPNVDKVDHRANCTLAYHHSKALHKLGIPPSLIIPTAAA